MTKDELIAKVKEQEERIADLEESLDRVITVIEKLIRHTYMFN